MSVPRLAPEREEEREAIVCQLPEGTLREDAGLAQVAETIRTICDVPTAYVSLIGDDYQDIVGHAGLEFARYDRVDTICAHTIVEEAVLVVEDAAEDERFRKSPFVDADPGVSFYVGLPLLLEDTPVGTLCALDTEPGELRFEQRNELFGLVNAVETHLRIVHRNDGRSSEHGLSSRILATRAIAARERFRSRADENREELKTIEAEMQAASELLEEMPADEDVPLGMARTEARDA